MINRKIIKLRKEEFSIREICKKLKTTYGTTQRVCSNIEMSKKGLERYSKLSGLTKNILFENALSEAKVRIIGNLLFDGAVYNHYYHYSVMYVNSSKDLIKEFIQDMKKVYNVEPSSFEDVGNYQRVKYLSKVIYEDLMQYSKSYSTSDKNCSIPNQILSGKNVFKIIMLRTFWENEGSISNDGRLSADSKSLKAIKQLSRLHDKFGLKHNICKYSDNGFMYKLYLMKTKENYEQFLKLRLFSKANVTQGYNVGKKKMDVLKDYFNKRFI